MANFGNDNQNTHINTQRASAMPSAMKDGVNPTGFTPEDSTQGLLQTSTNIFVYANGGIVGMMQSFRVSESRSINKLQAVGYEGVVQAVPSNTNGGQLDVSRFALYNSSLWQALGMTVNGSPSNGGIGGKVHTTGNNNDHPGHDNISNSTPFRTLKDQRVPLEIKVKTPINGESTSFYEERYVDCWLASYSKSYSVGTITVTENATIQYADVF